MKKRYICEVKLGKRNQNGNCLIFRLWNFKFTPQNPTLPYRSISSLHPQNPISTLSKPYRSISSLHPQNPISTLSKCFKFPPPKSLLYRSVSSVHPQNLYLIDVFQVSTPKIQSLPYRSVSSLHPQNTTLPYRSVFLHKPSLRPRSDPAQGSQ